MQETILIIEDEEDILSLLSGLLESENYHVITAGNGRSGIEKFQDHNPDLIITDVRMPIMDGIEVLREVKTKESDTEVIILTGHGSEADRKICMELGAFAYLHKPVDIELLSKTLKEANEKVHQQKTTV